MHFTLLKLEVYAAVILLHGATALTAPHFSYIGEAKGADSFGGDRAAGYSRHWTLENVTRLEAATEEAAIAYFIQVSESTVPLVKRLMTRLHHPGNFYALHFDKKIPAYKVVKAVSEIRANPDYKNVAIMERESVTYRGITMVLNNLAAISKLLELGDWDYFINISGSDYPLVSPVIQRKLLAMPYVREKESNFFTMSPQDQWADAKLFRYERITVDTALGMSEHAEDSQLIVLDEKTPLFTKLHYEYVKGEGWVILTRKACQFMLEGAFARKMLMSMAFSQESSEHYYVSLFWNHPEFNKTIVPHSLRTVYWKLDGVPAGQHPYLIDKTFNEDGSYKVWSLLRESPHFFARKFTEPDSPIMDDVDNEISGMGDNVNEKAVAESRARVESHLHWLFGMLPEE